MLVVGFPTYLYDSPGLISTGIMVWYEWFWHWHCVIMMKWCRKLRCDVLIFISTFHYFIPFRRMLSIFAVNWKIPSMGYIICVSSYFIWYKIMHYNQTLLISTLKRICFGKVSKTWFVYFIQLSALNNIYFLTQSRAEYNCSKLLICIV